MSPAKRVTIYLDESECAPGSHRPLFMAILELLQEQGAAGATATRGVAGFGAQMRIHSANLADVVQALPIVITWIDRSDQVERILPAVAPLVTEGLITIEDVDIVKTSHRGLRPLPAHVPVDAVMTRQVVTARPETQVSDIARMLIDKVYRAVPIVDGERHVLGLVDEDDLIHKGGLSLRAGIQQGLSDAERIQIFQSIEQVGRSAEQIMSASPLIVPSSTSVADVARQLVEKNVKRAPVVDQEGRLIGMISRIDVLRTIASGLSVHEQINRPMPAGGETQVSHMMMTDVPAVLASASLSEVLDALLRTTQARVIVVDDSRRVVGIITDGDLLARAGQAARPGILASLIRRSAQGLTWGETAHAAADIMTPAPICVHADTALIEALHLLIEHKIKRLPVVDAENHLVGMVGRAGILRALSTHL